MRGPMLRIQAFTWSALLSVSIWACDPINHCDPDQYFTIGACRPCPSDATAAGRTCHCNDPAKEFKSDMCRYRKGEAPPEEDAGAMPMAGGGELTKTCGSYCMLLKACIADNPAAAGAIDAVLQGFGIDHDDVSSCNAMCTSDGDEAENSATLSCLVHMAESSTCASDPSLDGVGAALSIIDACCSAHGGSAVCTRLCAAVSMHPLVLANTPACQ